MLGSDEHPGLHQHLGLRNVDGIDDPAQHLGERWGLRLRFLGSNSAGGNTDSARMNNGGRPATGDANCPPTQADVNAGLVNCAVTLSSGNDENGSTNYSTLDIFYNGQPVPQTPTAALSSTVHAGDTVTVTGGTNWWGANSGAPNSGPYGDFQNNASNFYPVSAPQVLIGTSPGQPCPWSTRR